MSLTTQDLFSLIQAVKHELQIQSQIFPYMIANKKITVRHASIQIQRMRELGVLLKEFIAMTLRKLYRANSLKSMILRWHTVRRNILKNIIKAASRTTENDN